MPAGWGKIVRLLGVLPGRSAEVPQWLTGAPRATWAVLMPEHAGRCLKPAQDCYPESVDKYAIGPLQTLAAFERVLVDGLFAACVTGG
jgi:hypothetical protein